MPRSPNFDPRIAPTTREILEAAVGVRRHVPDEVLNLINIHAYATMLVIGFLLEHASRNPVVDLLQRTHETELRLLTAMLDAIDDYRDCPEAIADVIHMAWKQQFDHRDNTLEQLIELVNAA